MPKFRFKIKGYLNETGEYSELHTAESGTIVQFILQHWFNESIPKNLDIILIENEAGDQLIIDHLKRDIFDYYYLVAGNKKIYYHKKTDIQFMFFVLECFFNNLDKDLRQNFNATTDDSDFILGDYRGKDFNNTITNRKLLKNAEVLMYPLIFLIAAIVFSVITASLAVLIIGVVFCLFSALLMYSTYRRLLSYYNDNKDIELKFSRGNDFLEVKKGTWSRSIPKTDIRNILKYTAPLNSVAEYHTEIEFINGNILNVTCLLVPQHEIELKFANDLVPIEFKVAENEKLERPTNLDKYFSSIKPLPNNQ